MKKKLIIIGIVIVIIVGLIVLYNATRNNTLIDKVKIIDGIKFSKAKIVNDDGRYIFYVTVTTTSSNVLKVAEFDATIYDKKGNRLEKVHDRFIK